MKIYMYFTYAVHQLFVFYCGSLSDSPNISEVLELITLHNRNHKTAVSSAITFITLHNCISAILVYLWGLDIKYLWRETQLHASNELLLLVVLHKITCFQSEVLTYILNHSVSVEITLRSYQEISEQVGNEVEMHIGNWKIFWC